MWNKEILSGLRAYLLLCSIVYIALFVLVGREIALVLFSQKPPVAPWLQSLAAAFQLAFYGAVALYGRTVLRQVSIKRMRILIGLVLGLIFFQLMGEFYSAAHHYFFSPEIQSNAENLDEVFSTTFFAIVDFFVPCYNLATSLLIAGMLTGGMAFLKKKQSVEAERLVLENENKHTI